MAVRIFSEVTAAEAARKAAAVRESRARAHTPEQAAGNVLMLLGLVGLPILLALAAYQTIKRR